MKNIGGFFALALCAGVAAVAAMDGVCIATIMNGPTFKQEASFGPLVKYEIRADTVFRVDTLSDVSAASPRINMSGTYYAYVKNGASNARSLVFKPLYGNPTSSVEVPLQKGANWVWWVEENSFFYTVNPGTGHKIVRKLTLAGANGQLAATDRMWVQTQENMQGGFVGLDLTGTKLSYKANEPTYACIVTGDSTKPPTNVQVGLGGCGNSISPSGTWWTHFPGGHAAVGWGKWTNTDKKNVWYTTMDSSWATLQGGSPLRTLEARWALYGHNWMKSPVGIFGTENIWSQNSEDWFISEVGMALNGDGDCVNAIAINTRTSKAINISQIVPARERFMNTFNSSQVASEFRFTDGRSFTGGTQRSADRPVLWCSSREDVSPTLWHYIENRQADNQHWSDLLGLPPSQIPATGVSGSLRSSGRVATLAYRKTHSGFVITLPRSAPYSVGVYDIAGRRIVFERGAGDGCALQGLNPGKYVVKASQSGRNYSGSLFVD